METITCKIGTSKSLMDIVNGFLLYTYQQDADKYIPSYVRFAQDVYSDLQFDILTSEIRRIYTIDKKLLTVKLPDDLRYLQQVSAIDEKHKTLIPLIFNNKKVLPFEEEIVAVPACPNPKCKTDICSDVRGITTISETVVIDYPDEGTEYTNTISTQLFPDGSIIEETCEWLPIVQNVSDYVVTSNLFGIGKYVYTIRINGINYSINLLSSNLSGINSALAALNLGTIIATHPGDLVFTSNDNKNEVQNVVMRTGTDMDPIYTTFNAVVSDTHSEVIDIEKNCITREICKVEMTDDGCIADTTVNVAVVKKCCFVKPCWNHEIIPPTISEFDGVLYFSNDHYDKVLITYKTSGINFGETLMVPEIAETAMISGLRYFSIKHKRNEGREKADAKRTYNIDKNKLVEMLYPIRAQEIMKASRVTHIEF